MTVINEMNEATQQQVSQLGNDIVAKEAEIKAVLGKIQTYKTQQSDALKEWSDKLDTIGKTDVTIPQCAQIRHAHDYVMFYTRGIPIYNTHYTYTPDEECEKGKARDLQSNQERQSYRDKIDVLTKEGVDIESIVSAYDNYAKGQSSSFTIQWDTFEQRMQEMLKELNDRDMEKNQLAEELAQVYDDLGFEMPETTGSTSSGGQDQDIDPNVEL